MVYPDVFKLRSSVHPKFIPSTQNTTPSPRTHHQTAQVYCQTIGQIQPGKCLSYSASLQAAAIAPANHHHTGGTPIMLQPFTATTGQLNIQIPPPSPQPSMTSSLPGVTAARDCSSSSQIPSQYLYDNQMNCENAGETSSACRYYIKGLDPLASLGHRQ